MATTSLVYGQKTDLSIYGNDDIIGATFTVTDPDGNAVSFAGLTALTMTIYQERGGTQLVQWTNGSGVSASSNIITWDVDYSADIGTTLDLNEEYFYALTWENASNQPLTISYGEIKVI